MTAAAAAAFDVAVVSWNVLSRRFALIVAHSGATAICAQTDLLMHACRRSSYLAYCLLEHCPRSQLSPAAVAAIAAVPLASVVNSVINLQQAHSQRVHVTATATASPHATTAAPTSAAAVQHTPHTRALLLLLLLLWLLLCSSTAAAVAVGTVAAATAAAASAAIDHYCCLLFVTLVSARQAHFCARWARPEAASYDYSNNQ
jgi:hypothetical protein